jgi:hypothetical protein
MISRSSVGFRVLAMSNAAFGALIIYFLIETLILRVTYSFLFFFVLYFLQNLIFDVTVTEKGKCVDGKRFHINRACNTMFFIGFLASLAVVIIPAPVTIYNAKFLVIFLGLPWWAFIRILLGLFLLSVFPGYILYDAFLSRSDFDVVEKIALTLALSFGANVLLGLILFKVGGLTSVNILIGMWIFVAAVTLARLVVFKKKTFVEPQVSPSLRRIEHLLLCLVFIVMLFSSCAIVLSSDVGDCALGGDITRYIAESVSVINGGEPIYLSIYALLEVFTLVGHYLTGLDVFASYVCLEFYVLLVPTSFYLLLKALYPRDRKPSVIGAVLISMTSGFDSLCIFGFMATYKMGGQSTFFALCNLASKTALLQGAFAYQFYVMPLTYSLLFLSLAFSYRYCCRGRRLGDLLLCGLFAVLPLFTHSIFEFSCFLVTLVVFLLFSPTKNSVKAFLKICLSVLLFFIPFEVTIGTYSYTFVDYSFHFSSVFGYTNLMDLLKFPLIALLAFVILLALFRKRISYLSSVAYGKVLSFPDSRLSKVMLFIYLFIYLFFILTLCFWILNWPTLNTNSTTWLPWYVDILQYGFAPYLIIVTLPYILKKGAPRSLLFMFSWLLSVFLLASLSQFYPSLFPIEIWGSRWVSFASYPLIGLAAIGLSTIHFTMPSASYILLRLGAIKIRLGLNKLYFPQILLIFFISISFLSYTYKVELFQSGTYAKNIPDPEGDAYNWILRNTPEDAVFLTVANSSKTNLESLACRKCFGYSDAAGSWPLQALFDSRLPETLLYSLKELKVSYVFVTPRDASLLSENLQDTYLNSLLNVLPVVYERENITLYAIPKYPLYEDSNYVLVSPTIDFQNICQPRASLAFHDDFSANLNNWIIVSGDWSIKDDELDASGKSAINDWCRIVSIQSFSNFIYEYKAKSMMPTKPRYIWGIFRYMDENNFYSFYIGDTAYRMFECVDGVTSCIASGNLGMTLSLTQWNSVKIEAMYSSITLYVNDSLIKTIQGTGLKGRIGLETLSNLHTCYGDVNVTSLTLPVDAKSALLGYQVASNMLVASSVNFAIVPDVSLTRLQAGNVYIFPYNWHVPEILLSNLQEYISQGAHVIFLDPLFGSIDELDSTQSPVLSSALQVKLGATSTYSDVSFENKSISLNAKCAINDLVYNDSIGIRILANYTLDNQITPYIIQKRICMGTLTFIYATGLLDPTIAPAVPWQDLLKNSLDETIKSLPKPVETRTELTLPFPQSLYKYILCNDIPTLLSSNDLYNYIYVYGSPMVLNGSCTAGSDYVLMMMKQVKVKELEISNASRSYSLRNESLSYIGLKGSVNLSLKTDYLMLSSSPYYGGSLTAFSLSSNITIHVDLINAELQLKTNDTYPTSLSFTTGNCTIVIPNSDSHVLKITLSQPVIKIKGSLNLPAWQGIFWYGDKAIIRFVISSNPITIRGNLSLQPLYSFGGIQIKVQDVYLIQNVTGLSK